MITGVNIQGFKRFSKQEFELAPLTVLAGLNGSGKTSFIQTLVLAREALNGQSVETVRLNGSFGLELGAAEDVLNWDAEDDISVKVCHGADQEALWRFNVPDNSNEALYLEVKELPSDMPFAFSCEPRTMAYLCAERLGPRSVLGASALPADALEVGVRGEYCAQVVAEFGDRMVEDKNRLHPDREPSAAPLLKYELERWLAEIVRPVEIDTESYPGASVTALRFRTPGGEWVRAPNMGFGVSYALPVVLAGLTAPQGGLLIIENPEAHLHPAGQSRMGVFLAWLASRGVQVVVETHSDHILNGVRRAIGDHGYLDHRKATVLFFDSDTDGSVDVTGLKFTASGGVSDWPRGFFDQYQIDIAALGRVRRHS